jgi:hypothetical protein
MRINKKLLLVTALCSGMMFLQSFKQKHDDDKPENLKVLPKDISEKDLHNIMRNWSMSLGVRCGYCHVSTPVPGQEHPNFDWASDAKKEKQTAREMVKMTMAINEQHLGKIKTMGDPLEQIKCVTCHMGRTTPIISVDSLPKAPKLAK